MFFNEDFDELTELEILELIQRRDELLNELDFIDDPLIQDEIASELDTIQEKLSMLY